MKKINIEPSLDKLLEATEFFEEVLTEAGVSLKIVMQINVAVDEIFSNIAHYSNATEAILGCAIDEEQIVLSFTDNGVHYDPTKKEDPDTTLSAEERKIGGLGIFMVKKIMDDVSYEYKEGWNILTLVKKK